ncbi:type II toxin-antitoxin system death-on-curing family toxin [Chromobacterium rhizoryzae]|uniref:Type II toxin-antitoxin system death-on-curing family toxin n=1 Tax=Chromobacterium rhizoryzae TaxID=1778675 RepID=A0AAD0RX38_9NEIS|nr:type II toxin-antitoxin system death-on-curing family toxin [Chromobacterium rhizoryzae]
MLPGQVQEIHDLILEDEPGLAGQADPGRLEAALERVENLKLYVDLDDVFEHAAMYAIALARGHVFADANKRTALVTALTYLKQQNFTVERNPELEQIMVDVAEGKIERADLADILYSLSSM